MSTSIPSETFTIDPTHDSSSSAWQPVRKVLSPLASLKVTVILFSLSLILVLMGTLAQTEMDVWEVMHQYFRCWITKLQLRTLAPVINPLTGLFVDLTKTPELNFSRVPASIAIWFPGGKTIGWAMLINLLAAHSLRFTVQSKGVRTIAGVVLTLLGCLVTWLVIESGHSDTAVQEASVHWDTLWNVLKFGLIGSSVLNAWGAIQAHRQRKPAFVPLLVSLGILASLTVAMFAQGGRGVDDSGMRILWQLIKGAFAGLVLLGGCTLLFKKRAGVVVLHAGIILMLLNESIVGSLHLETQMTIEEGQTATYADDIRTVELAFVDSSHAEYDDVVTVSKKLLESAAADPANRIIRHDELPFDVEVVRFLKNSNPKAAEPGETNLATAGVGLSTIAEEVAPGTGTDSGGAVDFTSAYVKLLDKKTRQDLGTFLVGIYFNVISRPEWQPNRITHDGTTWDLSLRFQRHHKPYSVKLLDVSKTDYAGTDTPRDYRSIIHLADPSNNANFERHIWMNNPLRYAGDTFYQSSYSPPDPRTGKEKTTLSVVKNTGWMIPYVACMIVAVGMLSHFWLILVRFVSRLKRQTPQVDDRNGWERALPWVAAALVAVFLISRTHEPKRVDGTPDYISFGRLPVLYEGRIQPFDTLAQNSLRYLSGYTSFKDAGGHRQPAVRWFLDVIAYPEGAAEHKVIRIDHPELQKKLGLEPRKGHRYALQEFMNETPESVAAMRTIAAEAQQARDKQPKFRTADERKVLELERRLGVLDLLTKTFNPPEIRGDHWKEDIQRALRELQMLENRQPPLAVPPAEVKDNELATSDAWETFARGWSRSFISVNLMGKESSPPVEHLTEVMVAHAKLRRAERDLVAAVTELKENQKDEDTAKLQEALTQKTAALQKQSDEFNSHVDKYRHWLETNRPKDLDLKKTDFEAFFNSFSPFYWSMQSYIGAVLMSLVALMGFSRSTRFLNQMAFKTILVTLVVHSFALWARYEISGRPPVTNLYSSAVFIGWGAVILSLVFEAIYRLGIGNLIASGLGAASLGIAHLLSGDGDTMKVMQAVLDTQFWLWTHVTCITLGYAVTFVAGFFGLLYVVAGLFTKWMTPAFAREVIRIIYGTICFGIFFSFVGTVLGGLWADDSWGRFWGWDPKENGALIIVLWNALVLHARWDGMVKDRGLAVLAIVGNVVTSWSWFGVNELGVGLHSYGFTEGVWAALWSFWLSQFALLGLGCLPSSRWQRLRTAAVADSDSIPAGVSGQV